MKARVALLASIFCIGVVAMATAQVSTVEGTVVSNSGGALVIDTDSGQRTFMVDAQSSLPADLAVGSRVRVEYHTLANDKFHAFKVSSLAGETTTTTTTDTTGRTDMTGTTTAPAPTDTTTGTATTPVDTTAGTTTGTMQEPPVDTTTTDTTTQTMDTTTSTERTLPATASPLPLLALAGGLAMAGGALLRRLR